MGDVLLGPINLRLQLSAVSTFCQYATGTALFLKSVVSAVDMVSDIHLGDNCAHNEVVSKNSAI